MATVRPYQVELLDRAIESNCIVYLSTGAGKTLISIRLIEAISESKEESKQIVFLAPTNALVNQQAQAISNFTELAVLEYCWESQSLLSKEHLRLKREWQSKQVLVMTPQMFLNLLQHAYMNMSDLALLIFDECHHSTKNHPYTLIMNCYYHTIPENATRPKIFGMTASPLFATDNSLQAARDGLIQLQQTLDSRLITVADSNLLNGFVSHAQGLHS